MTFLGAVGHTLPFLLSAMTAALTLVVLELHGHPAGVIVFGAGILIGSS